MYMSIGVCFCDGRDEGGEPWSAWEKMPHNINSKYMRSSKVKMDHETLGSHEQAVQMPAALKSQQEDGEISGD